jgi:hypothetical protein
MWQRMVIVGMALLLAAWTGHARPSTVSNQLLLGASPKLAACLVKTPQLPVQLSSVIDDPLCCGQQGDEAARVSCLRQSVSRINGLLDFMASVYQAREVESLVEVVYKTGQLKKYKQLRNNVDQKISENASDDSVDANIQRVTDMIKSIPNLLRCLGYLDNSNLG